jgi:hypothetical protein
MCDQDVLTIRYVITYDGGTQFEFPVHLDAKTLLYKVPPGQELPAWTHLDAAKCRTCPLASEDNGHCPAAVSLVDLVEHFKTILSYSKVHVSVQAGRRTVSAEAPVQKILSSLIGLHMATSGCPHLDFLRPMARFHLPFADREETLFRVAGSYLIAQFLKHQRGEAPDLDLEGLQAAYNLIHDVNVHMAQRMRMSVEGDANVNAIVILDLFAQEMPLAIDSKLQDLAYLYEPMLGKDDAVVS